jgi:hypothetical protein
MSEFNPTLRELKATQSAFDDDNFSGADTPEGKRRHIFLHLGKLVGKFAGLEEVVDHGITDTTILRTDIIPDMLVFAAQLAELENVDLGELYKSRLEFVAERNGTGVESAEAAIDRAME